MAATQPQPRKKTNITTTRSQRISKTTLRSLVRDFQTRLGADPHLYYLVNPPGGVTEEDRREVEIEIIYFLSRIHKDPTLDLPTEWLKELREYDLTDAEWLTIENYFNQALTASSIPPSSRPALSTLFSRLRQSI